MKTATLRTTVGLATALAAGLAGAQTYGSYYPTSGYAAPGIVRCESINSDRNFCRADTRGGVQISRQLSRETCIRGRNWDVRSDGIVVDDGCRAEFALGSAYSSTGYGGTYGGSYAGVDRYGRPLYTTGPAYVTDRYGNRIVVSSTDLSRGYVYDRYGNRIDLSGTRYSSTRDRYGNVVYTQPYSGSGGYYVTDRYGNRTWVSTTASSGGYYTTDRYGTRIWVDTGAGGYYTDRYGRQVYNGGYTDNDEYTDVDEVYERNRDMGVPGNYYGGTATAPSTYSTGVILCASAATGRTYCGDRNTTYTMHTDNSSRCLLNRTYGRDSNGTWVSGGCNLRMEASGY
jgi:hypothetical protein